VSTLLRPATLQDEFALLCEDLRLKRLVWWQRSGLTTGHPPPALYPGLLDGAPVFAIGELITDVVEADLAAWCAALPYPRVALLVRNIRLVPHAVYCAVFIRNADGLVRGRDFVRPVKEQTWLCSREAVQITPDGWVSGWKQKDIPELPPESVGPILASLYVLANLTRSSGGELVDEAASKHGTKIIERRARLGLETPQVRRIIRINLDRPPTAPTGPSGHTGRRGIAKPPHWRRGHLRTLPSGRQVWVRHCAIHGGGSEAPWYEVAGAAKPELVKMRGAPPQD
jgi:hypothetical protein